MTMTRPLRIVAVIAAFNEADIVLSCVSALIEQGVESYVLDDGSTDGTLDLLGPLVGNGVIAVERFGPSTTFDLSRILRRKEALCLNLDADWFINHDADEFRESPWPAVSLTDAISLVDAAGYNATDFALLDFWPTGHSPDRASSGQSAIAGLTRFEYGLPFNRKQVRCWRRQDAPVDLVSSGGHDVAFPDRRVFPLRFLLRHYPIRGDEHGRRKIWQQRLPRFAAEERARGWHVQYDEFDLQAPTFVRDPSTLVEFDPVRTRVTIALEDAGRIQTALDSAARDAAEAKAQREIGEAARQHAESTVRAFQSLAASAQVERDVLAAHIGNTLEPGLASAAANILQLELTLTISRDDLVHARATQGETEKAWQHRLDAQLLNIESLHAELNALQDTVTAMNEEVASTNLALSASKADCSSLDSELSAQRDAYRRLQIDANTIWQELRRVYASRTWRWSGAVRTMATLLGFVGKDSTQNRSER